MHALELEARQSRHHRATRNTMRRFQGEPVMAQGAAVAIGPIGGHRTSCRGLSGVSAPVIRVANLSRRPISENRGDARTATFSEPRRKGRRRRTGFEVRDLRDRVHCRVRFYRPVSALYRVVSHGRGISKSARDDVGSTRREEDRRYVSGQNYVKSQVSTFWSFCPGEERF